MPDKTTHELVKELHQWAFTSENSVSVRLTKLEVFKSAAKWFGGVLFVMVAGGLVKLLFDHFSTAHP